MYRLTKIVLVYFIFMATLFPNMCGATVTVTPASGLCLNVSPGAYSSIGTITIQEGVMSDFATQSGVTIILSAPAGFEFNAGVGSVSYTVSRNITTASILVTSSTITITYTTTGVNKADRIVISGIQARGLSAGISGTILRTAGTATITGDANGGGVNHGNLSTDGTGILVTSVADGNWSSGATWSTGMAPSCGQDVLIAHNVTADITSSSPNITVATGGNLISSNTVTAAATFSITGTGTYTHNNTADAATTIFAGTESFSSTSTIIVAACTRHLVIGLRWSSSRL